MEKITSKMNRNTAKMKKNDHTIQGVQKLITDVDFELKTNG